MDYKLLRPDSYREDKTSYHVLQTQRISSVKWQPGSRDGYCAFIEKITVRRWFDLKKQSLSACNYIP